MADRLNELHETYSSANQETKRAIGEYLYDRPGVWVPKTKFEKVIDIDESGVSRHLDDLHEDEFLRTEYDDGQLYVQWRGRGSGGMGYWVRRAVPPQVYGAIVELRPLLTLEALGGAYVPTLMFGFLLLFGFTTALLVVLVSYLPMDSLFGITVLEAIGMTGAATVMASVFFVLIPVARLIERVLWRLWLWISEAYRARRMD